MNFVNIVAKEEITPFPATFLTLIQLLIAFISIYLTTFFQSRLYFRFVVYGEKVNG